MIFPSSVTLFAHMRGQGFAEEQLENVNKLRKEMAKQ